MNIAFVSDRTFESWDWTNPQRVGIGGSETSHIEMAQGLARLGHNVVSFAPLDPEKFLSTTITKDPHGVDWLPIEQFQYECLDSETRLPIDLFIIYRAPRFIDFLPEGSKAWLICQDVDYLSDPENLLTPERSRKFTRIVALCEAQKVYLEKRLELDNIFQSSNGIRSLAIQDAAEHLDCPERNLHRMMYASSPDRGLDFVLQIFPRVREVVTDAELHVCYGWDNIDKVIARFGPNSEPAVLRQRLDAQMQQPGVFHHGRLPQAELLQEWLKSAIWCHPSNFFETSCITCMDAQACGAIPVTSPIWAVYENVRHGYFIDGDVRDSLVQARYINQVIELMLNPQGQNRVGQPEVHRAQMMEWAQKQFDWTRFIAQWDFWAKQDGHPSRGLAKRELMEAAAC